MSEPGGNQFYEFGPFRLDATERLLERDGSAITLTPKAFETLLVLVEHSPEIVEKDELMETVWPDTFVEESNLAQNVSALRKKLGERPDGGQYIETIPRRGYRLGVEARSVSAHQSSPVAPVINEEVHEPQPDMTMPRGAEPARRESGWLLAVLGLLAAALVTTLLISYARKGSRTASNANLRIAVMPFKSLKPDPESNALGFAIADSIITRLNYVSTLTVIPSLYIEKYRSREISPREVARELKADALLTGTMTREGDDLRIDLELIDMRSDRVLWGEPLSFRYDKGFLTIQDRVASQVIGGLELSLTAAESEQWRRDLPHDPQAYQYHLRGIERYYENDLPSAKDLLLKSVALDPNFALSWAYLGTVQTTLASLNFGGQEEYSKAEQSYDRALSLNPTQIEARVFKAAFLTDTGRVEEAVPLLRGVVQDNPNHAGAHWELSYAYRFAGMLGPSIEEGERSRRIESEIRSNNSVFNTYLYDGQYTKFLESLPRNETDAFILFYRGLGSLYLDQREVAIDYFNRAIQKDGSLFPAIVGSAMSLGLTGNRSAGIKLLADTEKSVKEHGVRDPEGIYKLAQAYALLENREGALRMFRQSVEGGFFCYPYFSNDRLLSKLASDAQFQAILDESRRRHETFRQHFF
jgi:DNA-binding winged helix-turn-helix (wHTH) protein/TolB-like protein/tetratricopeptide (TPR) repeat protein